MSIGTGIVLFVIGAILTFAINVDLGAGINLDLIGYILMGAGLVVFIIGLVLMFRKRESITTVRHDGAEGSSVSQRSTRSQEPPVV